MSNTKQSWWSRLFGGQQKQNQKPAPKKPDLKPSNSGPYVFVTKSGKKFHYDADCSVLQGAWERNEVIKMDLSKAKKSGRTACSRCCWDYLHE